jgi:cell division protein FtsQ
MSGALVFRLLAWSFALLLLALPVAGLLNGSFASDRWPLRHLDLQAELKQVSLEQIQGVVSQHTRKGFFALSLAELRNALAGLPWVESVEVRKRWPDTVSVRLLEYQPYAIWDGRALVSRSGHLFQVPGVESLGGLPRLSGPDAQVAEVVNFHARAIRLLQGAQLTVTETRLSPRGSWSVVLDGGAEVLLGREQKDERLARFAATIASLLRTHPDAPLRHADLRYPNGYALTWSDPAADATPARSAPSEAPAELMPVTPPATVGTDPREQQAESPATAAVASIPVAVLHASTRAPWFFGPVSLRSTHVPRLSRESSKDSRA